MVETKVQNTSAPVRVYCDGGLIGGNNSRVGGTWSFVVVDDRDRMRYQATGFLFTQEMRAQRMHLSDSTLASTFPRGLEPFDPSLTEFLPFPEEPGFADVVTNNHTEYLAALRALEWVKNEYLSRSGCPNSGKDTGWDGKLRVHLTTDSSVTRDRLQNGGRGFNVPAEWQRRFLRVAPSELVVAVVDGHPSNEQLEVNSGKRGNPVSLHNRRCDHACTGLATLYKDAASASPLLVWNHAAPVPVRRQKKAERVQKMALAERKMTPPAVRRLVEEPTVETARAWPDAFADDFFTAWHLLRRQPSSVARQEAFNAFAAAWPACTRLVLGPSTGPVSPSPKGGHLWPS